MNEWKKIDEDGQEIWVNDSFGNIIKTSDDFYVAIYPKIVKLGPFKDLEIAKQKIEKNKQDLEKVIDSYNLELLKN